MLCPNKNTKSWIDLVEKYGEVGAYIQWSADNQISANDPLAEVRANIRDAVLTNEDFYRSKYASFLRPFLARRNDIEAVVEAFTQRFDGLSPKINGDIVETNKGNYLLFPEAELEYANVVATIPAMHNMLNSLKEKFGIPFVVINDENFKWEGRFINQGDKKIVVINTAFATPTTALHEYYHPFVRALSIKNPPLFEILAKQAKALGDLRADTEEVVTDFLSKSAKADTNRNYLQIFWDFLKKLLKLNPNVSLSSATTLNDIFSILNEGIDLSKENTLTSAYKKIEELGEKIANKYTDRVKEKVVDYIEVLKKNSTKFTTSDSSDFYQGDDGSDIAKRLSAFIGGQDTGEFSVTWKNKKMPGPEYYARRLFFEKGKDTKDIKREDITSTVIIEGVESTFEQVLSAFEQDLQRSQQYGKMVHSFVQYLLETDPEAKARAKDDAVGYAKKYGKEFTALEKHPDLKNIDLHFEDILERSGIVADPTGLKGISKSKLDRIAPEITLVSELLKDSFGNFIGTTADGIIQHANGEISLVDWKTGDIAKDMNTAYLMKYGSKFGISDSRLARGYLEVAFRAVILKEKHPDMRFRNIRIIKLNRDGSSQNMDVDLQPYLYTIGEYYKENHPEIYKEMVVKGMLEASQYEGISEKVVNVFDRIAHLPFEEQLLYLKTKLAALHGDKTKQQIERDPEIKKLSALYSEAILELEKLPGMNLKEQSPDLPSFGGLKNFSDVANPKLQVLHKILLDAKNTINQITSLRDNEHNKLYEAVQKESKLPKTSRLLSTSALAGVTYGLFTLQFLPFAGSIIIYKILSRNLSNTKDHFAFIWQKQNPGGKGDLYMNNEDWYLDGNSQVIKMTKAQMEYRNFIRDSMGKDFNAFASKVVEYTDGDETRPVYMFQKLGLPSADLPVGFMPRIPKPIEELREEENFLGSLKNPFGLKTTLGASAKNYFTSFIEDTYEDGNTPIPLRYFKHTGSKVVDSGAHSLNVEAAYKSFMASLHYKDNMDSVKNLFIGMSNAFDEKLDEKLNAKYPKTVEWLDNEFYSQVLEKSKSVALRTKKWHFTAGPAFNAVTSIPKGTPIFISQDRVIRAIKSSVTFSVMGFKVWSPIRNALMITAQNITQSTRSPINNLLSKIVGVPPETFEGISLAAAKPVFVDFLKAKITGKEEDSKLWNIAKKFDWLPDNYGSYHVDNDRLLSQAIQISPTSHAYMFYQMGETLGALWQLAGIMKGTKIIVNGKEISMWDAYDNKAEWTAGSRGEVESSPGIFKDLTELDTLEIKSLKRAYEKLNGSYRSEEKTAIETTVLGEFLFQFKKYFFQYLKVLFADPYKDITVGKYVLSGNRPDGMPVYQWHSDIMEGQMKVLVNAIFAAATLKKGAVKKYLTDTNKFGENTLEGHRARALGTAINTLLWYALLLSAFFVNLDDDEEKSYAGRALRRTIDDLSRGMSPKDLLGNLEKPVVASEKIAKVGQATFDFMLEGMWGKQNSDGWPKGLKIIAGSTPGISGAMQLKSLFKSQENEIDSPFTPFQMR